MSSTSVSHTVRPGSIPDQAPGTIFVLGCEKEVVASSGDRDGRYRTTPEQETQVRENILWPNKGKECPCVLAQAERLLQIKKNKDAPVLL